MRKSLILLFTIYCSLVTVQAQTKTQKFFLRPLLETSVSPFMKRHHRRVTTS